MESGLSGPWWTLMNGSFSFVWPQGNDAIIWSFYSGSPVHLFSKVYHVFNPTVCCFNIVLRLSHVYFVSQIKEKRGCVFLFSLPCIFYLNSASSLSNWKQCDWPRSGPLCLAVQALQWTRAPHLMECQSHWIFITFIMCVLIINHTTCIMCIRSYPDKVSMLWKLFNKKKWSVLKKDTSFCFAQMQDVGTT